jgi:sulfatase maturation enzyme AslB (radical SAM superfamily)
MRSLKAKGLRVSLLDGERFHCFIKSIVEIAKANGMEIFSCAEGSGLDRLGVASGKCIDDRLIEKVFGIQVTHKKDPHQRPACGCVMSKDIGVYDTCPFNCVYCYATKNIGSVKRNFLKHDPKSLSL